MTGTRTSQPLFCFDEEGNRAPISETRRIISLPPDFPKIVCLIGSSRFKTEFERIGHILEASGALVLRMAFFSHSDQIEVSPSDRETLYRVDCARLDLADEVFVVNCKRPRCPQCFSWVDERDTDCHCPTAPKMAPYVGTDTQREIDYALSKNKPIYYLEEPLQ